MAKKIKYKPKSFESYANILPRKHNGELATDVSVNIYASMLLSKAWKNLTGKQKDLYLHCKMQYFSEKKSKEKHLTTKEKLENINADITKRFTFNKAKWDKMYHLYNDNNARYFYKDMRALIDNGFIDLIESGKLTRETNIYEFSDRWRIEKEP